MSRMYDALSKAQHEQSARRDSDSRDELPQHSNGARRVAASSERVRAPNGDLPPLFLHDPNENFNLWMQNCFPDASVTKEDAIRTWLATPLERRVEHGYTGRSVSDPNTAAMCEAKAPNTMDYACSNRSSSENAKRRSKKNLPLSVLDPDGGPIFDRFVFWMRKRLSF
jgi:hypothetical protein